MELSVWLLECDRENSNLELVGHTSHSPVPHAHMPRCEGYQDEFTDITGRQVRHAGLEER